MEVSDSDLPLPLSFYALKIVLFFLLKKEEEKLKKKKKKLLFERFVDYFLFILCPGAAHISRCPRSGLGGHPDIGNSYPGFRRGNWSGFVDPALVRYPIHVELCSFR